MTVKEIQRIAKLIACGKHQTKSILFHSPMKTTLLYSFCSYPLLQTKWSILFHSPMKTTLLYSFCSYPLLQTIWSIFFHSPMKTSGH